MKRFLPGPYTTIAISKRKHIARVIKALSTFFIMAICSVGVNTTVEAAANKVSSLTVTATQMGSLTYGTAGTVTYAVSITPTGGSPGGSTTLSLGKALPAGATASWSTNPVTLPSGTAAVINVTLTITSSATTPAGTTSGINVLATTGIISTGSCSFIVNKAALSVTANAQSKTYGSTVSTGAGSTLFTSTGLMNSETIGSVTITIANSGATASATVAGSPYTITPSSATGGTFNINNYILTYNTGALMVNVQPITISASDVNKPYGQTLTGGPGSSAFIATGLRNNQTVGSVTITYGAGSAASDTINTYIGSVTPSAATGGTFLAGNYSISYVNGNIIVGGTPITITANNVNKTYGTALTTPVTGSTAFIITSGSLLNGETIGSITIVYGTGASATDAAGIYNGSVTPSAATGGTFNPGSYVITYATGNIIVSKAPLTVTGNNVNKLYGQTISGASGSGAFTSSGLVNNETIGSVTITYGTGSAASVAVGTYTGSVISSAATGGTFAAGNYNISYATGNIVVGKAALTITSNNQSKCFAQNLALGTTAFTTSAMQNGETVDHVILTSISGNNGPGGPVGTYTNDIVPSNPTGSGGFVAGNYNINYNKGSLTVNPVSSSSTSATSCDSYIWNGSTYTTSGSYVYHTINSAGCDSAVTLNLTIHFSSTSVASQATCNSFVWNGSTYTTSGDKVYHTTNAAGCDSAVTLHLTVNYSSASGTSATACNSYVWNSVTYTTSGSYVYHTPNAAGCDSAATLNLAVGYSSNSTASATSCDSYIWNGSTYTTSGSYVYHTSNSAGCDSAATLNLIINFSSTSVASQATCDSFVWNGSTYTTSGDKVYHTTDAAGCDSAVTLHLTISYSSASGTSASACNSYVWNSVTYTTSGSYVYHTTNAAGCDSAAMLDLAVGYSSTSTTSATSCDNYIWNGGTYTTSGSYVYHTSNAGGCDSVATLNLIINFSSTSVASQVTCNSFVWNGSTYTTSGDKIYHTTNAAGCDSAVTLHLTINYSSTSGTSATACNSYVWNSGTYTSSGSYVYHTSNAAGCDSAVTLNLIVNYSNTSGTSQTACNNYSWNGSTYTTSGNYIYHTANAEGCDSAVTLNLTINHSSTSNSSATACNSYAWNASTYTSSGSYVYHTANKAGCDSAATLNLTIKHSTTSSVNVTATSSYVWNGMTYTASANDTRHFTNAAGCDSATALILTIGNNTTSSSSQTACNSYIWNGSAYTNSGAYVYHTANAAGADSAATLNLTINKSTTSVLNQTACGNYAWNGTIYTTSTTDTRYFTNSSGCDSIATLHLTITTGCAAGLILTKTPDKCQVMQGVPTVVTYTYVVTNADNVLSVSGILRDDNGTPTNNTDDITISNWGPLAPGASATCTHSFTISNAFTSVAIASGMTSGGQPVGAAAANTVRAVSNTGFPTADCSSPLQISCVGTNGNCSNGFVNSVSVKVTKGTAPYSYSWNNGATTSSITKVNDGTYSATVRDATGAYLSCSATVTKQTSTSTSTISSAFNSSPIATGSYIWFNSVINVSGASAYPVTITFLNQKISSSLFNLVVPNGTLIISKTATQASTVYTGSQWQTTVPFNVSGNYFLSGYAYRASSAIGMNLSPVKWSGVFTSTDLNVTINWAWAAAVYPGFSANYSLLGVKSCDDVNDSLYHTNDPAGCPENYKTYLTGGATGGGGSNYCGTLSGTNPVMPCVASSRETETTTNTAVSSDLSMNAYPNPSSDKISVVFNSSSNSGYTLRMADLTGRLMISREYATHENSDIAEIDISRFAEGIYIISATDSEGTRHAEVVVKH